MLIVWAAYGVSTPLQSQLQIGDTRLKNEIFTTNLLILHFLSAWTTYCISSYCNNNNNYSNNCVYKLKPLVPSAITLTETEALAHVFNNVVNSSSNTSTPSTTPQHHRRRLRDVHSISTPPTESPGVPCLGSFELLTWATTGSARDLGDRSERGSGAGAPTPPTG